MLRTETIERKTFELLKKMMQGEKLSDFLDLKHIFEFDRLSMQIIRILHRPFWRHFDKLHRPFWKTSKKVVSLQFQYIIQ